jgi:hypothetical protein
MKVRVKGQQDVVVREAGKGDPDALYETQLSDTLKLRIQLSTFQDKWGLSIWRFWRRRGEEDWHPSDKGLRIGSFAELEFVYATLSSLMQEAAELLPPGERRDL